MNIVGLGDIARAAGLSEDLKVAAKLRKVVREVDWDRSTGGSSSSMFNRRFTYYRMNTLILVATK